MKKVIFLMFGILISFLITLTVLHQYVYAQGTPWKLLYSSTNLTGHSIVPECNPGGGADCPCSDEDVDLVAHSDYGEVIANPFNRNTWVNAIGYKKFVENLPDGSEIKPDVYRYTAMTKMPILPSPDADQQQNPEVVEFLMMLYDGRNKFGNGEKVSLEATVVWKLNPWAQEGAEGRIYVYTTDFQLIDTGLRIPPDTDWHTFTYEVDFLNERFISLTVDGNRVPITTSLLRLNRSDWGDDIALSITTESMSSWPQSDCRYVFYWNQYFKDVEFKKSACISSGINTVTEKCDVDCGAESSCDSKSIGKNCGWRRYCDSNCRCVYSGGGGGGGCGPRGCLKIMDIPQLVPIVIMIVAAIVVTFSLIYRTMKKLLAKRR